MNLFCRELRSNEVLNWTSDRSIVTFMPNRTYVFDPETSCEGCDDRKDTFMSVNIPLMVSRAFNFSACENFTLHWII